jgi:hypothetical protein
MPASPAADPVLKRFRAALDTLYSDRIAIHLKPSSA